MRYVSARLRRLHRSGERGQALVEFAIVSVVLFLVFATVIDFGRIFYAQITVENAARAGALVAAQAPDAIALPATNCTAANATTNKIGCAVQNEARGSLVTIAASDITVSCESLASPPVAVACSGSPQPNTRSRVSVTSHFSLLTPILQALFGRSTLDVGASVAADDQALPSAITVLPTAAPTPTPTPTPMPTASPTPTPSPTPTGSLVPCAFGEALIPDLVNGKTGKNSPETLDEAQTEWQTAGFSPSLFFHAGGFSTNGNNSQVGAQYTDNTMTKVLTPGVCAPVSSTTVYVTHK